MENTLCTMGLKLLVSNRLTWMWCRNRQQKGISQIAGQIHMTNFLIGVFTFASIGLAQKMSLYKQLVASIHIVLLPMIPVYLSCHHNKFFTQWYNVIIVLWEGVAALVASFCMFYIAPNVDNTLFIILICSPVVVLFVTAIWYPSSFRVQFPGQFFCMVFSHFWIYPFCDKSHANQEMAQGLNRICTQFHRHITSAFAPRVDDLETIHPCLIDLGFLHFVFGFVLPCTIKYILESHMKAKYLASKFEDKANPVVWAHYWAGVRFSISAAMFCITGVWTVMAIFTSQATSQWKD